MLTGLVSSQKKERRTNRPIKVRFQNENDKIKVLKRLHKLHLFRIRITEDLSKHERELVKTWWKKAEEKNQQNKDKGVQWKVRGSPRTGLYLKKIVNKTGS